MTINEKILDRRIQLGFSATEVAERAEIGIYAYGDIEAYEDEAIDLISLSELRKLCEILDLNLLKLLDIPKQQFDTVIESKPRNVLIKQMREQKGLSEDELGDKVGFYTWAIKSLESDPDYIDSLCVGDISRLAEILDIPIQLLIRHKN